QLIERFGSEFAVLLDSEEKELKKVVDGKLAEAIVKVSEGKVEIRPGYDGVYGYPVFEGVDKAKLERKLEKAKVSAGKAKAKSKKSAPEPGQKSLREF
ncbi:MAG: endonuclease Q family protein, partial [Candidatus Aenigmarchaeota archaeon]|nr:endonuclease Q family protein [Candidatus Aenigmarchaeota archaeon]